MNERRTLSMLQRLPVILAVTAASYGLQFPPVGVQKGHGHRDKVASPAKVASAVKVEKIAA